MGLSLAAGAVPVLRATLFRDAAADDYEVLLWLLLVVPPFLMAYYRGWTGAVTSLAVGMVALVIAQVWLVSVGGRVENWPLLGGAVVALIAISLGVGRIAELLHVARAQAEDLALTDELTLLPNRRQARMVLDREFAAAWRGRELTAVLFDLDNFKEINDRYGHEVGDEVLRQVGGVMDRTTRRMNLTARYGGEEFLSIVSSVPLEGALVFVERVRRQVAELRVLPEPVTVSAGVAAFHGAMKSPSELIEAADAALYEAKLEGRDRVRVYGGARDAPSGSVRHPVPGGAPLPAPT